LFKNEFSTMPDPQKDGASSVTEKPGPELVPGSVPA